MLLYAELFPVGVFSLECRASILQLGADQGVICCLSYLLVVVLFVSFDEAKSLVSGCSYGVCNNINVFF